MHLGGWVGSSLLYISLAYYMQKGGGWIQIACKISYVLNESPLLTHLMRSCDRNHKKIRERTNKMTQIIRDLPVSPFGDLGWKHPPMAFLLSKTISHTDCHCSIGMLPGVEIALHRAYLVTCGRVQLESLLRPCLYLLIYVYCLC